MNKERWHRFSLAQQLGNIGSEITRARIAQEKGQEQSRQEALLRAIDLVNASLQDSRWTSRRRELARFQEVLGDWYAGTNVYSVDIDYLEEYCLQLTLVGQKS